MVNDYFLSNRVNITCPRLQPLHIYSCDIPALNSLERTRWASVDSPIASTAHVLACSYSRNQRAVPNITGVYLKRWRDTWETHGALWNVPSRSGVSGTSELAATQRWDMVAPNMLGLCLARTLREHLKYSIGSELLTSKAHIVAYRREAGWRQCDLHFHVQIIR